VRTKSGVEAEKLKSGKKPRTQVKIRTLHTPKGSAPREFQSCLKQTPVPRGKDSPPAIRDTGSVSGT
jgi:hypothetical protein